MRTNTEATVELWQEQAMHNLQASEDFKAELKVARREIRKLEKARDAALLGYNECRATIEDARVALNAHEHEGLLLASLRVQDQLAAERAFADRLAEELEKLAWLAGHEVPNEAEKALAAWKEARGECR